MQNYRLKSFFYNNWKQFQVFKKAKFEFKVTVHYGLWENASSCDPLIQIHSRFNTPVIVMLHTDDLKKKNMWKQNAIHKNMVP